MSLIWYGLDVSLAYPSGEGGGNFLVHMICTCLPSRGGKGGVGVGTLWLRRTEGHILIFTKGAKVDPKILLRLMFSLVNKCLNRDIGIELYR
jgi:hypothetical protein